ncbi:hypothetical protein AAVH_14026 [Aphelenchoides avenae]|nr:hypothetical protein AAVH_14026 [Aphelenchus avenae]
MSQRIRKDALMRIGEDALVDVGCCLNRFDVKCNGIYVSGEDNTRKSHYFDGPHQEAFQLCLAAIKHSDVEYFTLSDTMSEDEAAQLAAIAANVKVDDLRFWGCLTHLSPSALYRLMFGFASVKELTLRRFNGNQTMDDHLRECGRKQICDVHAVSELADVGPLAVSDEAMLDYLFAPVYGMRERNVAVSAFTANPQFVQKLVSRAQQAIGVERINLEVKDLPLGSQHLGGLRFVETEGSAAYHEELENGANLYLHFGPRPASPLPEIARWMDAEEELGERFSFTYQQ